MLHVGLDVSSARVALCVMDDDGATVRESVVDSDPQAIDAALADYREDVVAIGLETGPTTPWVARALRELGLPAVVIDATHAAAALRTGFRNKTDRNDARGIADLMRVRKFRPVHVKSTTAQRYRTLLAVREQLRRHSLDLRNAIWPILQAEGLRPPKLARSEFRALVDASMADPALSPILTPLVHLIDAFDAEISALDRRISAIAKTNETCRLLMTGPGVGPLVALTFVAAVDDPTRFAKSRNVGADFGLTPRRYQSGDMDWSGGIGRAGDAGVRRALYQAANALIHHSRGWCALKSWAVRLAGRRGLKKAKVALARKLAVVLHRMWITGEPYRIAAVR